MPEAYCVKCKAKKEMKDPKEVTMKNGRKAMKGKCPDCGTGMYRIMGKQRRGSSENIEKMDCPRFSLKASDNTIL